MTDLIACYRVADESTPRMRSVQSTCSQCNAPIWVALSSPIEVRRVCIQCGVKLVQAARARGEKIDTGDSSLEQTVDILETLNSLCSKT